MVVDSTFLKEFATVGAKSAQNHLQACETRLGRALQVESEKAAQGEAKRQATEEHLNSLQNASQNIRGKLERCKKAMELVHRHTFIPDTASREDTENFRSGLLEQVVGFDEDDELSGMLRDEETVTTISAGCLFGARMNKLREELKKVEKKTFEHNQKIQRQEKRQKQIESAKKRKALRLLDDEERDAARKKCNKRRRHIWTSRKGEVQQPAKKKRKAEEDFSEMPAVKKRKKGWTIEKKYQVVQHFRELVKQAKEQGKSFKKARCLAATRSHFRDVPKSCRIQRWVKEAKTQNWEEIPQEERSKMYQLSDAWKKARKLGNLRENGNVRWFVPQIVQDQLDRFLARSTMGISNVTGRNEEVLIEQLASTASAMCKEYNIGLEKARFPVELSFRFFVSPDRHHA
jgi:hypothetical protein